MSAGLAKLFKHHHEFKSSVAATELDNHATGQQPDFMFLACSDSRVAPSIITRSPQGQLFECRNVANQANPNSDDWLSILEYAVNVLEVKHIIVCGHTLCGGIQTALAVAEESKDISTLPAIQRYLKPVVQLYHDNAASFQNIVDKNDRVNHLVKLNVLKQVETIQASPVLADAPKKPNVFGAIYDIPTGQLKMLKEQTKTLTSSIRLEAIESEIARLQQFANSYNPFKFLGAQAKANAVAAALQAITESNSDEISVEAALNSSNSDLYLALNSKRLLPFSFGSLNGSLFSNKSHALLEVQESEQRVPEFII